MAAVTETNKNGSKNKNKIKNMYLIALLSSNHLRIITAQCVEHIATVKYSYMTLWEKIFYIPCKWCGSMNNILPSYFYYISSSETSLF